MFKLLNSQPEQWRAHVLRTKGLPFDSNDLLGWYKCLSKNMCLKARHYDELQDHNDPMTDERIAEYECSAVEPIELEGRSQFSLSLPADCSDKEDLEALYAHVAHTLSEHGIENIAALSVNTSQFDNTPDRYPYVTVWCDSLITKQVGNS